MEEITIELTEQSLLLIDRLATFYEVDREEIVKRAITWYVNLPENAQLIERKDHESSMEG